VVEKSGEFREACPSLAAENGNPEPSPGQLKGVREGAETRASARTLREKRGGEAPDTLIPSIRDG